MCAKVLAAAALALFASSCALVGNVKPVDEKSETYQVADLSQGMGEWAKLPPQAGGSSDTSTSDVAYQSQKTASIISLNSACRPTFETEHRDLKTFTNLLFLGISDVTQRDERDLTVESQPALETTLKGKLNNEEMMLRTVVLRRGDCVYDLMYVARPEHFAENEADFSRFVDSLKLR
jgi:hypothetical protein